MKTALFLATAILMASTYSSHAEDLCDFAFKDGIMRKLKQSNNTESLKSMAQSISEASENVEKGTSTADANGKYGIGNASVRMSKDEMKMAKRMFELSPNLGDGRVRRQRFERAI